MKTLNKIQKELKAPKGQTNSFGNYKYRSCEDILEAVKPHLGDAVLTISDEIVMIGDRFYVKATATLMDSGFTDPKTKYAEQVSVSAYARESLDKKGMDSAQITGATSSYARKYALNGLFCIDDTKDADTQDNSKEETKAVAKPKVKPAYDRASEAIDKCVDKPTVEKLENAIADNEELTDAQKQALLVKLDAKAQQIPE